MAPSPLAGAHYPRSVGEFQAWFSSDADCLDYLEWLRWPEGFVCPECGHIRAWQLADGRYECRECHERTSVTAGTIFDRTRTPLTVWFMGCRLFATQKDGISALSLKRSLEIGSYQTAWAMLHRLRSVLVRPGRERLEGVVEVDESYFGGEEPGLPGGRAKGKKVLVGVAVERLEPKGFGRCRMVPLPDASGDSLRAFLLDNVNEGAKVALDLADRQPARVERDHPLVEPDPARLALADDLGLERPGPVPRRAHPHRALVGQHRLGRRPVAAVAGAARRRVAVLVAEMLGDLGPQRALQQPPRQLPQQPVRARDLLRRPRAGQQLVDQLIRELGPLEQTAARQPRQRGARGGRGAGASLHSPSGLAPLDAGATLDLLDPAVRVGRHDARFRSCLHRSSDTPPR